MKRSSILKTKLFLTHFVLIALFAVGCSSRNVSLTTLSGSGYSLALPTSIIIKDRTVKLRWTTKQHGKGKVQNINLAGKNFKLLRTEAYNAMIPIGNYHTFSLYIMGMDITPALSNASLAELFTSLKTETKINHGGMILKSVNIGEDYLKGIKCVQVSTQAHSQCSEKYPDKQFDFRYINYDCPLPPYYNRNIRLVISERMPLGDKSRMNEMLSDITNRLHFGN